MRDLVPDGVGFDLGLKFSYKKKKKKRFPLSVCLEIKFWRSGNFLGEKKFNMFMLKIYVIDFKYIYIYIF